MADVSRLIRREPRRKVYPVHLDDDRAQRRADMVQAAKEAAPLLLLAGKPVTELTDPIDALDAEAEALIHLVAIGVKRVEQLKLDHAPTKQQIADAKRLGHDRPTYDPDEVLPRLLAEAIEKIEIDGEDVGRLTVEQLRELVDSETWPHDQVQDLVTIAFELNYSPTARAVGNV